MELSRVIPDEIRNNFVSTSPKSKLDSPNRNPTPSDPKLSGRAPIPKDTSGGVCSVNVLDIDSSVTTLFYFKKEDVHKTVNRIANMISLIGSSRTYIILVEIENCKVAKYIMESNGIRAPTIEKRISLSFGVNFLRYFFENVCSVITVEGDESKALPPWRSVLGNKSSTSIRSFRFEERAMSFSSWYFLLELFSVAHINEFNFYILCDVREVLKNTPDHHLNYYISYLFDGRLRFWIFEKRIKIPIWSLGLYFRG